MEICWPANRKWGVRLVSDYGVRGSNPMKSFHHYTLKKCSLSFISEVWGTQGTNKQPTRDASWGKWTKQLKISPVKIMATPDAVDRNLNARLATPFIKSFLWVTEHGCETSNSPNYGYTAILPLPCFFSSFIALVKTHKLEKHPCNTMHMGIPLNYPYVPQIQISTDVPVFRTSPRVSEKHSKDLSPRIPPHYSWF